MSPRGRAQLAVVSDSREPSPAPQQERPKELGLYAETRSTAKDLDRWRRLHERSHGAPAINLAAQARRIFAMKGGGVRQERGGFKFDERL